MFVHTVLWTADAQFNGCVSRASSEPACVLSGRGMSQCAAHWLHSWLIELMRINSPLAGFLLMLILLIENKSCQDELRDKE